MSLGRSFATPPLSSPTRPSSRTRPPAPLRELGGSPPSERTGRAEPAHRAPQPTKRCTASLALSW